MPPSPVKLRLLCLHGFQQTGQMFRAKLGGFRKMVRGVAELEFVEGPHVLALSERIGPETGLAMEEQEEGRAWRRRGEQREQEVAESIAAVEQAWQDGGGYDGLLCFSQGAALGGLLCLLQHQGKLDINFHFIIVVSGFISDQDQPKFREPEELISLPSLHVMGEKDRVIEASRSLELSARFHQPHLCHQPGGHYLPYTGDTKTEVLSFLGERLEQKMGREGLGTN